MKSRDFLFIFPLFSFLFPFTFHLFLSSVSFFLLSHKLFVDTLIKAEKRQFIIRTKMLSVKRKIRDSPVNGKLTITYQNIEHKLRIIVFLLLKVPFDYCEQSFERLSQPTIYFPLPSTLSSKQSRSYIYF